MVAALRTVCSVAAASLVAVPTGSRVPPSREEIARIAEERDHAGIFLDFDGSLAPIVDDPESARALPGTTDVLVALGRRFAVVAVVSGRPAAWVADAIGRPPGVQAHGLYGLERVLDGRLTRPPDADAIAAAADRAAAMLRQRVEDDGVWVEHKGLAIAVHVRRARDPDAAQARMEPIVRAVAGDTGLTEVRLGRRVIEVGPAVDRDKGTVVRSVIAEYRLRAGLVAGDDRGDIPAFEALDDVEVALRIAVASGEAPPEILAAADAIVEGPSALLEVLRTLARAAGP